MGLNREFLQHIASDGDRWDTLSYQYYADPMGYQRIISANRHLPINATLQAGQIVFIPIITVNNTTKSEIPPWLRD